MEHVIHRYRFRVEYHGRTGDYDGRIVEYSDRGFELRIWVRTAEQPDMLLEVQPVPTLDDIWPLFRTLCDHRGVLIHQYRMMSDRGIGPWMPVPGARDVDSEASNSSQSRSE